MAHVRSGGVSIFAIDPGGTSGWAWSCLAYSELQPENGVASALASASKYRGGYQLGDVRLAYGQVEARYFPAMGDLEDPVTMQYWAESNAMNELLALEEVYGQMASRVSRGRVARWDQVVVIEDFILRRSEMNRSLLSPVRLGFGLVHQMRVDGMRAPVFQSPSDKAVINDERLRKMGLWISGQPHARDAMRHLVLYLRRHFTP